jgi:hypothetical protein
MTAARRLAAILAVDFMGLLAPRGRGRGGDGAVYERREAARPITFNAKDRFPQPRPRGLPVTMAAARLRRSA